MENCKTTDGIEALQSQLKFRLARDDEGKLAPNRLLPLVIEPSEACSPEVLSKLIRENREQWNEQLWRHGGLLFRGFPVERPEQFEEIARAIDSDLSANHPLDDLVRTWRTEFVFEALSGVSNQGSPNLLPFHNEDSYLATHPGKIMFYCLEAPPVGGETPIVDCREVLKSLPESLVQRFAGRTLHSTKSLPFPMVSANTNTADKAEIEEICKEHQVEKVAWGQDDTLHLEMQLPPIIRHPKTGEPIWFNRMKGASPAGVIFERTIAAAYCHDRSLQLKSLYRNARLALTALSKWASKWNSGDGRSGMRLSDDGRVSTADQLRVVRAYWKHAVVLVWKPGDVLVLDNRLAAHGRMPFVGQRVILACVTKPSGVEAYLV